jgi:hypothetical protein
MKEVFDETLEIELTNQNENHHRVILNEIERLQNEEILFKLRVDFILRIFLSRFSFIFIVKTT